MDKHSSLFDPNYKKKFDNIGPRSKFAQLRKIEPYLIHVYVINVQPYTVRLSVGMPRGGNKKDKSRSQALHPMTLHCLI
jgi:hypothetical protein